MDVERVEALARLLHSARARELRVSTEGWSISLVKGSVPSRAAPPASGLPRLEAPLPTSPVPGPPSDRSRITAPMVGIFRSAEPRLVIGDHVEAGQPVGAIESMKILNPLVSEFAGEVTAVPVEDGQPVEYGQPLLELRRLEET
jgi:acetyl-CoA carboxylase biotin carboxyl carrier protein